MEPPSTIIRGRIAKYLSRAGIASRRDIEAMIAAGRITLNGEKVAHPAIFIEPNDEIIIDGIPVSTPDSTRLWRYHKPRGLVTTHKDPKKRQTVFDALPDFLPRVISVGRLDLTSEGLLLLTNDGSLARRLELPSNGWTRRYRVRVFGPVDPSQLLKLKNGIIIEGTRYASISAVIDSRKGDNTWLTVSLKEGKNREIRRIMKALNLQVSRLIRISYGPFQLGNLPKGKVAEIPAKVLYEQIGLTNRPNQH